MERELVERARRGDREAYEVLVRRKVDAVHRTSMAILGNAADAQDAVQEAFLAAWRRLPGLRDPERFDAWLGRIVVNACRMTLRRRRVREVAPIQPEAFREPADPRSSSFEVDAAFADVFDRAFERLTVDQRTILVLHHRDELSVNELAERLEVPPGTVKSRLFHARRALAQALDQERGS